MYPFMGFSPMFPIGLSFGIISLILFAMYFLRYAFSKKFFGLGFLLIAIIYCIIALSLLVATAFDIFLRTTRKEFPIQEFVIDA